MLTAFKIVFIILQIYMLIRGYLLICKLEK